MIGTETTGISGNLVGENHIKQKKKVNVKTLSDGSVGLCTYFESSKTQIQTTRKIFILQKVNDPHFFLEYTNLMQENPSPTNLDNDPTLDYITSCPFSFVSPDVVIESRQTKFIATEEISRVIGTGRYVISVGVRRTSTGGTVYLDKIKLYSGYITSTNTFITQATAKMTPTISSTSDTFVNTSGECFIANNHSIPDGCRFAIHFEVYAHVDAGTTVGEARINVIRGSADSYVEIPIIVSEPALWKYKRSIALNPATSWANYPVKIMLTPSNFDYSKTKANGEDLRFYQTDGTPLDYWIETWNTTGTSTIWVKVATSGTNTINMYYGNPSATSASNGFNTFDLFDDFSGWLRYSGNPVITKGSGWEARLVYTPRILKNIDGTIYQDNEGKYWLYYSGGQLDSGVISLDQMGLATSPDLYNWTKYENNPVLPVGASGTYDYADVVMITVMKDCSVWRAWYEANSNRAPSSDYVRIAYAYSSDGKNWTKYANNPVLSQGTGDDSADLYAPCVIKDGNTWKMWYCGHRLNPEKIRIMYATAPNPEGPWTRYSSNYIFDPGYDCFPSEVWKENNTYYMLYFDTSTEPWRVRLATSSDGISWTEKGWLFGEGLPGAWDSNRIYWPSQAKVNNTWYTFFTGYNGNDWSIGVATSKNRIPTAKDWTFLHKIGDSYENQLRVSGLGTGSTVEPFSIQKSFFATQKYAYRTKFKFTNNLVDGRFRYFTVFGTSSNKRFGFSIGNTENKLYYLDGNSNVDSGITLSVDTIYELMIVYNTSTQTADYYFNNTKIKEGATGTGSSITNKVTFGSLRTATNDNSYFDDFFVRKYTSPEPTATVGDETTE